MDIENAKFLGSVLITLTSILGAYYLVLKIRQHHSFQPNPKYSFVTQNTLEKVRAELIKSVCEAVQDLRSLRAEIRDESRLIQKQYSHNLSEARELINQNSQNISALIAQSQIANQRISELALKSDRIILKLNERNV